MNPISKNRGRSKRHGMHLIVMWFRFDVTLKIITWKNETIKGRADREFYRSNSLWNFSRARCPCIGAHLSRVVCALIRALSRVCCHDITCSRDILLRSLPQLLVCRYRRSECDILFVSRKANVQRDAHRIPRSISQSECSPSGQHLFPQAIFALFLNQLNDESDGNPAVNITSIVEQDEFFKCFQNFRIFQFDNF